MRIHGGQFDARGSCETGPIPFARFLERVNQERAATETAARPDVVSECHRIEQPNEAARRPVVQRDEIKVVEAPAAPIAAVEWIPMTGNLLDVLA